MKSSGDRIQRRHTTLCVSSGFLGIVSKIIMGLYFKTNHSMIRLKWSSSLATFKRQEVSPLDFFSLVNPLTESWNAWSGRRWIIPQSHCSCLAFYLGGQEANTGPLPASFPVMGPNVVQRDRTNGKTIVKEKTSWQGLLSTS